MTLDWKDALFTSGLVVICSALYMIWAPLALLFFGLCLCGIAGAVVKYGRTQ